ncbi:cellulose biosynthesis cyclic di-GMP-binding regulatory protein BcsB [Legionella jordanis]|uniref:Cyclic di-GMP-binding protein n=1 Tax=Legionella jordanis TaxID=456 RepID=A0A0W0VAZ6_9GAMM|nr:cellulose biosynthesis cyclic di-GMP-binding regulatory protein BcsB [Legionella jordanis]KTD17285.1 cellulose synthase regulator protein [Legionella jordanis]RMW99470.1 hypothetical protein EAW55_13785 [Legionella jordanis]RMX15320.1 hypothetical protein EAS68_12630 [Legionella jordanis]VEH12516.1 cellulose synthase regulator protein [Legionella jordanis]
MKFLRSAYNFFIYHLLLFSTAVVPHYCLANPAASIPQNSQGTTTAINESDLYTFEQLGWDSSITLNGYQPNYTFYLPIPKRLNIQKAFLHLKMAFSPLLKEGTRVDLHFNQTPIRHLVIPNHLNEEVSWDIELPLTNLSPDWQKLTFSAKFVSTKNLCDPDIWIYISPQSSLSIAATIQPFMGSLNQLPYPFIDPTAIKLTPTLLLLPSNPTAQEIFSLLNVATQLGQSSGDQTLNLSVGFINENEKALAKSNLILIATFEHLKQSYFAQTALSQQSSIINKALKSSSGILVLTGSPFNSVLGQLIITGNNSSSLNKAASAFLSSEFTSLSSGKIAVVEQIQTSPQISSRGRWYQSSLKELGYPSKSVSGLGQHRLTYSIPLPNNHIPLQGRIKTYVTAPIFPGKNYSYITLLVNGLKQSTYWLTKEHSNWQAEIDSSAMKPGINTIDYLVNLHREGELCTPENAHELWATIHAETQFETGLSTSFPLAMLNQLPVPFSNKVNVILPDVLSKDEIDRLANLFYKFGQLIAPNPLQLKFHNSRGVNEEFVRNHNVILYGTPETNPWVKFALEYMPVQLNGASRLLKQHNRKLQVTGEQSFGLLELTSSPWSEDNAVLLITANAQNALYLACNALNDDKTRMSLNGNIALINSNQSIELLNSYDNSYISLRHRVTTYIVNVAKNIQYYLGTHLQILIIIFAIIVPIWILLRRKKRGD